MTTDKPKKHLESLTIQNFRILEDVNINKLGHVNLIVGKNNSGKSTVLEALALLASGYNHKTVNKLLNNRNVNRHIQKIETTEYNPLAIQSLFPNTNKQNLFNCEVFIGNSDYRIKIRYDKAKIERNLSKINSPEKQIELIERYDYSSLDIITSFVDSLFNYRYVETTFNIDEVSADWESILLTESEDITIQMLQIIEPNIIDLAFITEYEQRTPYVRLKNKKERVPLHEMGDGIFRLLQIILKVLNARDGFLLIDEFENGLHYSVQAEAWRLVFELAKRFNIQIFATTHSLDCVRAFAQVADEREEEGQLIRMGRSNKKSDFGKVMATVINENKLCSFVESDIEVR